MSSHEPQSTVSKVQHDLEEWSLFSSTKLRLNNSVFFVCRKAICHLLASMSIHCKLPRLDALVSLAKLPVLTSIFVLPRLDCPLCCCVLILPSSALVPAVLVTTTAVLSETFLLLAYVSLRSTTMTVMSSVRYSFEVHSLKDCCHKMIAASWQLDAERANDFTVSFVRNSHTPSLATMSSISLSSTACTSNSGSANTPNSSATESPIDRVNAVPGAF
mmetsp:Transcript_39903/g.54364  ORF Transcript_39903/g.54364 Transcript_39903/m.54364 type:complete len:217 (-) Transcript_39903:809-1459(-)